MHSGELCGNSAVVARDSCSLKSSVTDHRHHSHHHVQPQQHQQQQQQTQSASHQTNAALAIARSLCYDEQRRLHTHHHRQQQQRQSGDTDRVVAPSSTDCIGLQPHSSALQQRLTGGGDVNHQLDHYGETAASKLIKSEPSESALAAAAAVVATAVGEARKLTEPKTGRTAVGNASTSVTVTSADNTIDSLLHGVSSTSVSSSLLNGVVSRHHHHHHSQQQQQQQTAEMQQTSSSCSFTVSSLVHPTTGRSAGSGGGGFASLVEDEQGREVSVDGVLNNVDRGGGVVDSDSTCFDPSTAAAAAAQWFAAAGGHHQASQQSVGYSSRCTPDFYMQRLHASIAADRRHSVAAVACIGLGDADVDSTVPPPTPAFSHYAGSGGYAAAAAWYGAAQSTDAICSPTAGSSAYIGGSGLHDVFDVSAATRMLSTRQSCAQLQTDSPFRAYYGTGGTVVSHGPPAYAAYAEDCTSAKY